MIMIFHLTKRCFIVHNILLAFTSRFYQSTEAFILPPPPPSLLLHNEQLNKHHNEQHKYYNDLYFKQVRVAVAVHHLSSSSRSLLSSPRSTSSSLQAGSQQTEDSAIVRNQHTSKSTYSSTRSKIPKPTNIIIHESLMEEPFPFNNEHDSSNSRGAILMDAKIVQRVMVEETDEDENKRILQGCLLQQQQQQQQQQTREKRTEDVNNNHHYLNRNRVIRHEALIQSNYQPSHEKDDEVVEEEIMEEGITMDAIILQLYRYHLLLKQQILEEEKDEGHVQEEGQLDFEFILQLNNEEMMSSSLSSSSSSSSAIHIPYLIPKTTSTTTSTTTSSTNISYRIDKASFIQHLHEYSYSQRGTEQSRTALDILGILSNERNSFSFHDHVHTNRRSSKSSSLTHNDSSNINDKGRNVISYQPQILPQETINEVMEVMNIIKANQWLSTNPDSVDGLPSLHLNLISGGIPLFHNDYQDSASLSSILSSTSSPSSFEKVMSYLTSILQPFVHDKLLPIVKEECQSSTVEISDVFLRYYGRDVKIEQEEDDIGSDNYDDDDNVPSSSSSSSSMNNGRFGLSPHYDVFSSATSVIALDSTASTGRNGLYTIYKNQNNENDRITTNNNSKTSTSPFVSSHAALKQFFPLNTGDGVVHTFDILHGVDVDPDLDCSRTSLIIWFIDKGVHHTTHDDDYYYGNNDEQELGSSPPGIITDQPWLLHPDNTDHLKQFILALASDCKTEIMDENNDYGKEKGEKHSDTTLKESDGNGGGNNNCNMNNKNAIHELYIKSAKQGNAFALNSLAEICIDGLLSSIVQWNEAKSIPLILDQSINPFLRFDNDDSEWKKGNDNIHASDDEKVSLARALWFESSMRGNRVAQASLGDSLMEEFMLRDVGRDSEEIIRAYMDDEDLLLSATTFFVMSAQQGYDVARDALGRIIQIEYSRKANNFVENGTTRRRSSSGEVDDDEIGDEIMMQPVIQTALRGL